MSVAGIIDAMRSSYPPTVRLVWQCLENHANGARFWSISHDAIAAELRLSPDSVDRGVATLERDRIIRCVRHKRRPTTFYMLRTYPDGCPRPRHEPEVAARVAPELTPQIADSSSELTPQIAESFFHQSQNPPEEEDARERARPTPQADEILASGKEARRIEEVPPDPPEPRPAARVPFPDEDPELTSEIEAAIREAGHDPAELRDEVRDWANREGATSNNWPRVIAHWARQTPPPRRRRPAERGQGTPTGQPAKPDRILRTLAAFAAVRQQREARP